MPRKERLLRKLLTCGETCEGRGLKRRVQGEQRKGFGLEAKVRVNRAAAEFVFLLRQVLGSTVCVAEFAVNKWLCQNIITLE